MKSNDENGPSEKRLSFETSLVLLPVLVKQRKRYCVQVHTRNKKGGYPTALFDDRERPRSICLEVARGQSQYRLTTVFALQQLRRAVVIPVSEGRQRKERESVVEGKVRLWKKPHKESQLAKNTLVTK